MKIGIIISILGAASAIIVSIIGAWLANKNSITLQTRKLKENHYVRFMEALHELAATNSKEAIKNYVFARDKLFLIANENVIKKIIDYEEKGVAKPPKIHDKYLTELIKEIRKDLKIKDKHFPQVYLKKGEK